jgi:adenine-specific DNA-methyltransferase
MAYSVPKTNTKWAKNPIPELNPGNLSTVLLYEGKQTETDILSVKPATPQLLWSGTPPTNRLYFGDNLPLLAHLLKDQQIRGKVRLVYIDPPYATNGVFQSRAQVDAYHDLLTGPQYIEFLRQRLILLRELLAEDGSIYVHLDEHMAFHIKIIMDEVFGEKNFRNFITRRKSSHKNYTRKTYGNIADYILFYTKSAKYVWNRPFETWTDERGVKEYNCIEPATGRRFKKVPIHAPGVRNGATGNPWRGMLPPPGKHWQYIPDELEKMDERGEIYWSANGNPRRKIYLDNSNGVPLQDIWYAFRDTQNQNAKITGYPTEKNPALLDVIIEASSNPGDLVLDCFAGSGTTLDEASKLGRYWIGVDESSVAIETILRRFAHGSAPMGDYVTKPKSDNYQQLSLLDIATNEAERLALLEDSFEEHQPLKDFAFYSGQSVTEELKNLVKQWESWI